MRKLLNTLYITKSDAYLSKDGENIIVSIQSEEIFRIPVVNIEGIVTFGYVGASPGAMQLCASRGVSLTFLSPNGRFIGRLQGPQQGNVLLRKSQYLWADDERRGLHIARLMIAAKIKNYRNILRRNIRDYGTNEEMEKVARTLEHSFKSALNADSKAHLRGIEGDAAACYFSVFNELITNKGEDGFTFNGRNRRPPRDAVNALLSFVYTLICHEATSALETVGLDPYVGMFHALRPGRASLALDLMEEFRAYLGDRLVLSLINRRQILPSDFVQQGESVIMKESCKKTVLDAWQKRKRDSITHPYLGEKIEIGLLPYCQAMLLARFIRGSIDDYPVFLIS